MRTFITIITFLCLATALNAQSFNDFFTDQTLRIDYIFSGKSDKQFIHVSSLAKMPGWAGRRNRLAELPLTGNGQVTATDKDTGQIIYKTSFSSLFQEWLETDEAATTDRSYENTFLIPFPKKAIDVEIKLLNSRHECIAKLSHSIDPEDILIRKKGFSGTTPHKYIEKNGSEEDCIDLAIMAEGYTQEEMDTFYKDAQNCADALFSYEPFKSNRKKFNIVAVASPSKDSGVSIPKDGEWKETAFGSHYSTFYSDRYLTTPNLKAVHDALAGIPYEHILIIANTDEYGGGGIYNSYLMTSARHRTYRPVIAHEFGHSFAGLADEYYYDDDVMTDTYPLDVEPWEQNVTTMVDFGNKWKDMLKPTTPIPTKPTDGKVDVGVFEGGAYSAKGIYRPAIDCRMKTNECPEFCPVCQRAIKRIIDFYTVQ